MARKKRSTAEKKRASTAPARKSRRAWIRPGLVAVVLLAVAFVLHARAFRFTQDDAYISLRYAQNLVDGQGLVFNPGERVEGYSNFTWTLLLALFLKLGAPAVPTATFLGTLFGVAAVLWAAKLAAGLEGRWGVSAVGTAALVAGSSALALWSTGGLETALFALLVTASLERGLAPGVSGRGRLVAPVLFSLAAMTRPDGPLLFVLWFLVVLLDTFVTKGPAADPRGLRGVVRTALLFGLPLLPYAAWKLWYYGDLLPNTYYAKAGFSLDYVARGWKYTFDFFLAYGIFGLAPLLALVSLSRDRLRGIEVRLLFVWLGYAAYLVGIGGDVLYVHRFWLATLPIGCVLVARGAARLAEVLAPRVGLARGSAGVLAGALIAILVGTGLARNWEPVQERRRTEIAFVRNMRETGVWLGKNLEPGSTIAITTIGAISYHSGLRVIDLLGLTDREIARNPKMIEGLEDTWREIKYNAESVLERRPDAFLFSTGIRPSSAAEKSLYLYRTFHDSYSPYYFRSISTRIAAQVMYRLRDDAPPIDLTRLEVTNFEFLDEYGRGLLAYSRPQGAETALPFFQRTVELSPTEFRWAREWLGATLADIGDSTGWAILESLAASDRYAHLAFGRLGLRALQEEDFETARDYFERARTVNPDDAVPYMGLAEVARVAGDFETARDLAAQSIRMWDTNPDNLVFYGSLCAQTGDLATAENCYRRALAIRPDMPLARNTLETIVRARAGQAPRQGSR